MLLTVALALTGCGGGDPSDGGADDSEQTTVTDLESEYLAEIETVAPDYFVSYEAALLYVRNYCDTDPALREPQDAIDDVVEAYCDTALAER